MGGLIALMFGVGVVAALLLTRCGADPQAQSEPGGTTTERASTPNSTSGAGGVAGRGEQAAGSGFGESLATDSYVPCRRVNPGDVRGGDARALELMELACRAVSDANGNLAPGIAGYDLDGDQIRIFGTKEAFEAPVEALEDLGLDAVGVEETPSSTAPPTTRPTTTTTTGGGGSGTGGSAPGGGATKPSTGTD